MTSRSSAAVETNHASRYVQQLCRHWQHSLPVEFDPDRATIVFPHDVRGANWPADATATLAAEADRLIVHIEASSEQHLSAIEEAVASHIDRFAFREGHLTFDWRRS